MDPKRPRPTPPPVAHPSHRSSWPSKPSSSLEYSRRLRGSSACPPSACCVPAEYPLSAHHGAHRRTRGMAHVVGPRSQRGELVHSGVSSAPGWDVFWRHARHSAAGAMAGAPPQTGDRSDARSLRRYSAAGAMAGAPPQTGDRSDARSLRRSLERRTRCEQGRRGCQYSLLHARAP